MLECQPLFDSSDMTITEWVQIAQIIEVAGGCWRGLGLWAGLRVWAGLWILGGAMKVGGAGPALQKHSGVRGGVSLPGLSGLAASGKCWAL